MSVSNIYRVSGMTSGHCVNAVTEEFSGRPGVEAGYALAGDGA